MRTRAALAQKGFDVLTEIDGKATLKSKLDIKMPEYRVFGAWNPMLAHQSIGIDPRLGTLLPFNVITREIDGGVDISAINPVAALPAINNAALHAVAGWVHDLLAKAVATI